MKVIKSITIEKKLEKEIAKQAKKETRNFSNMISKMAEMYFKFIKKD